MHIRVVRFKDVDPQRIADVVRRIEGSEGPPEGVPSSGVQILFDESQKTAVALMSFATAEDMEKGGQVMDAMDTGETPGSRVSVDMCELMIDRRA